MDFKNVNFVFLKNKLISTRLWRFVLTINYLLLFLSLLLLLLYFYYWDSLYASLNSHYEALSYMKKKHKIIIAYRKSV